MLGVAARVGGGTNLLSSGSGVAMGQGWRVSQP
jgi:hypothetical protein